MNGNRPTVLGGTIFCWRVKPSMRPTRGFTSRLSPADLPAQLAVLRRWRTLRRDNTHQPEAAEAIHRTVESGGVRAHIWGTDMESKPESGHRGTVNLNLPQSRVADHGTCPTQPGRVPDGTCRPVASPSRKTAQEPSRRTKTVAAPAEDTTGFLFCVRCGAAASEYTESGMCPRCRTAANAVR